MAQALEIAADIARDGSWGDEGAMITVCVAELDEQGAVVTADGIDVAIPPNHEALIRQAAGGADICGLDPDHHDWTSKGEGGCDQNPGVWSHGGTSLTFASHCRRCGLHRVEHRPGCVRDPGEHDTVRYTMLSADEIAAMREGGAMATDKQSLIAAVLADSRVVAAESFYQTTERRCYRLMRGEVWSEDGLRTRLLADIRAQAAFIVSGEADTTFGDAIEVMYSDKQREAAAQWLKGEVQR